MPKGTQKEPWSVHLNPNGRIPVLVDRSGRAAEAAGFAGFQTAMILLHLELHY
ncbi:hypothetical protein PHLCEN_2v12146 [Hermanssonia centrifuga]|uniref:GST N-terminal domain-containing protein n=1 Tax=Hermanssonia centrifuga TaxID=98765 RepID=A0A2R6NHS0_9APHY|nr:hypothetical protein PHLCEN_2v12146 [Hermanssonia centrifuga]